MATELLWHVRYAQVHVAKLQEIGIVPPTQSVFSGAARGHIREYTRLPASHQIVDIARRRIDPWSSGPFGERNEKPVNPALTALGVSEAGP